MPDLTGKTLGAYEIIELIGRGGMASVYKAYQPGVERHVAVKVLPAAMAGQETFAQRFLREARVVAQLQHPYILPVFDFGQAEGVSYLVMPYIQSGALADRLQGGPMSMTFIRRVARQMGEALDYAHSQGLLHRDIKPGNILMDQGGNCMLADFGIAKLYEAGTKLTRTGGILGTPAYMSPEQARGETLDHRSDIYALGVILYHMATGQVPFTGDSPISVALQHATKPVPPPRSRNPALSAHVEQVLVQALAKDPDRRFQKASAMANALEDAAARATHRQETLIESPPAAVGGPQASRFNRRLFAGLAILLVLMAVGGGALVRALTPPEQNIGEGPPGGDESALAQVPATRSLGAGDLSVVAALTSTPTATAADATPVTVAETATPTNTPAPTETTTPTATPQSDWRQGRLTFILSQSGAKSLYTQDLGISGDAELLFAPAEGGFLLGPTWSADGQRIALYNLGGQLYIVDAGTGEGRTSPQSCTSPTWSPTDDRLLCRATNPATFRIFDADTGAITRELTRPSTAVLPKWSPDGGEIAYALLDGDVSSIWRMSLETQQTVPLADDGGENYAPAWSPDGQWVAYQSRLGSANSEIWIVDRNGQNARRLTNTPSGSWSRAPTWSPDGQWLAFVSNQRESLDAEHGEVYIVNIQSGDVEQVTFTGGSVYNWRVDWAPGSND